jgi:hypothetical protein
MSPHTARRVSASCLSMAVYCWVTHWTFMRTSCHSSKDFVLFRPGMVMAYSGEGKTRGTVDTSSYLLLLPRPSEGGLRRRIVEC